MKKLLLISGGLFLSIALLSNASFAKQKECIIPISMTFTNITDATTIYFRSSTNHMKFYWWRALPNEGVGSVGCFPPISKGTNEYVNIVDGNGTVLCTVNFKPYQTDPAHQAAPAVTTAKGVPFTCVVTAWDVSQNPPVLNADIRDLVSR